MDRRARSTLGAARGDADEGTAEARGNVGGSPGVGSVLKRRWRARLGATW
jgi:hypothetical protein